MTGTKQWNLLQGRPLLLSAVGCHSLCWQQHAPPDTCERTLASYGEAGTDLAEANAVTEI